MGAWKGLRKAVPKIELVAFEPLQSPLLTTGKGGAHQVEGIGVGFEPPFLDQSVLTEIRAIDQEKVFAMCRQLAHKEGFFVVTELHQCTIILQELECLQQKYGNQEILG